MALSPDESESDEESFFFLPAAGAAFTTGAGCFLLGGGATSSESELELLDAGALRLMGCAGATAIAFTSGFFLSSSDESDEEDSCFFVLTCTVGFVSVFFGDAAGAGFFAAGLSSSESLLLELAGFFAAGVGADLVATTGAFF